MGEDKGKYPPDGFPVIFSDGVQSCAGGSETVRFYLSRFNPDIMAVAGAETATVCQIVMSTSGFIGSVLFLQKRLADMVKSGAIPQHQIDAIQASLTAH